LVDVAECLVKFPSDSRGGVCGGRAVRMANAGIEGEVVMGGEEPGSSRFGAAMSPGARVEFGRAGSGNGLFLELDEALFLLRAEAAEEGAGGRDHHAG